MEGGPEGVGAESGGGVYVGGVGPAGWALGDGVGVCGL